MKDIFENDDDEFRKVAAGDDTVFIVKRGSLARRCGRPNRILTPDPF